MKTLAQERANQAQHVLPFLAFPAAFITQFFQEMKQKTSYMCK